MLFAAAFCCYRCGRKWTAALVWTGHKRLSFRWLLPNAFHFPGRETAMAYLMPRGEFSYGSDGAFTLGVAGFR